MEDKGWKFDWRECEKAGDYCDKKAGTRWAPQKEKVEERCRVAREWLSKRKEKDVVVVTHGGVLHYLTEDWADFVETQGMSSHCSLLSGRAMGRVLLMMML